MYRGKNVKFKTSKFHLDRLFECNRESSKIWNMCLDLSREYMINNGKWISKSQLQAATKNKALLHSQSIQAVCHKYLEGRDSARKLRVNGHIKARYPYKKKHNYNTIWVGKSFKIFPNGRIELSLGIQNGKRTLPIVVRVNPKDLPYGDIKEIELCYDNGLYLALTYDDLEDEKECNGVNSAGVDLGEIHSVAGFANNGEAIIITGRKLRSINRLRNKKVAEIQRKQSKCKNTLNNGKSIKELKDTSSLNHLHK